MNKEINMHDEIPPLTQNTIKKIMLFSVLSAKLFIDALILLSVKTLGITSDPNAFKIAIPMFSALAVLSLAIVAAYYISDGSLRSYIKMLFS